jgi:hypothetical protein
VWNLCWQREGEETVEAWCWKASGGPTSSASLVVTLVRPLSDLQLTVTPSMVVVPPGIVNATLTFTGEFYKKYPIFNYILHFRAILVSPNKYINLFVVL